MSIWKWRKDEKEDSKLNISQWQANSVLSRLTCSQSDLKGKKKQTTVRLMLSWQIFPCIRKAIILKRQVLKNTREISVIYSVRSGNPSHMLILGEELKASFSSKREGRDSLSKDHEDPRKCNISKHYKYSCYRQENHLCPRTN